MLPAGLADGRYKPFSDGKRWALPVVAFSMLSGMAMEGLNYIVFVGNLGYFSLEVLGGQNYTIPSWVFNATIDGCLEGHVIETFEIPTVESCAADTLPTVEPFDFDTTLNSSALSAVLTTLAASSNSSAAAEATAVCVFQPTQSVTSFLAATVCRTSCASAAPAAPIWMAGLRLHRRCHTFQWPHVSPCSWPSVVVAA